MNRNLITGIAIAAVVYGELPPAAAVAVALFLDLAHQVDDRLDIGGGLGRQADHFAATKRGDSLGALVGAVHAHPRAAPAGSWASRP